MKPQRPVSSSPGNDGSTQNADPDSLHAGLPVAGFATQLIVETGLAKDPQQAAGIAREKVAEGRACSGGGVGYCHSNEFEPPIPGEVVLPIAYDNPSSGSMFAG